MTSEVSIKKYDNLEDLRRDLLILQREFADTVKSLDHFRSTLAEVLAAGDKDRTFTVRGPGSATQRLQTLPQKTNKGKSPVQKNFAALKDLLEQRSILNNMLQQLKYNFAGDKKAERAAAAVNALVVANRKELKKAWDTSAELSQEHVPTAFKTWVTRLRTELEERFKGRTDRVSQRLIVNQTDKGNIQYIGYIQFTNLVTDNKFSHSKFYIILTQEIELPSGEAHNYATLSPKFVLPGHYKYDVEGDNLSELRQLINDQLALEISVNKIHPKMMPVSEKNALKLRHPNVDTVSVQDNHILVTLKMTGDLKNKMNEAIEIRNELQKQLIMLVKSEHPRNRDIIRSSIRKEGAKIVIEFVFTLPHGYRGKILNQHDIIRLKEIMGLDETEIRRFQNALDDLEVQRLP